MDNRPKNRLRLSHRRNQRVICFFVIFIIFLSLISAFTVFKTHPELENIKWVQDKLSEIAVGTNRTCGADETEKYAFWNKSVVNRPITTRFRDALKPDERYITAFMNAGWTNDVMAAIDLIYLSILTSRIPILPPFYPSHVGASAGIIPFSAFFDVPLLSKILNIPILSWESDLKNVTQSQFNPEKYFKVDYYGGEDEELGCWSVWMTQHLRGGGARGGELPNAFTLDISWTPVPPGHQVDPDAEEYVIHALASLNDPVRRTEAVKEAKENYLKEMLKAIDEAKKKGWDFTEDPPKKIPLPNRLENQLDPDDHLLCFDYLYFTSTHARGEFAWDDSPIWNTIGTHLHFSPHIMSISYSILRKALSIPSDTQDADIPPLITVHIRRNDFTGWCGDVSREDCLAPLSAYIRRVDEVRSELLSKHPSLNKEDMKVIVMTDEPHTTPPVDSGTNESLEPGTSEKWWEEVDGLGWKSIRHDLEGTAERYGAWYPSVIDACLLSLGSAFVGTDRSTYSLIAKRRVEDWQNGPVRMVRWGFKGADDR